MEELRKLLGATPNAEDKDAGGARIEGSSMANFDLDRLLIPLLGSASGSLGAASRLLSSDPWSEELGGIEMSLDLADDLCGRYASWFIDRYTQGKSESIGRSK